MINQLIKLFLSAVLSLSTLVLAQENPLPTTLSEQVQVVSRFVLANPGALGEEIRDLIIQNVPVFTRPPEKINLAELRLLRFAVRRQMTDLLATEGYFSPVIKFDNQVQTTEAIVHVNLELGPLTQVTSVKLSFVDDTVPVDVQQTVRSKWMLPVQAIFRDVKWSQSKSHVIESLVGQGYAAAKISSSEAVVQDQHADLSIVIDSGPRFRIGELDIKGLSKYEPELLQRYHPPVKGEVYDQEKLAQFQRALQNSPYFSSVEVTIDPDSAQAGSIPVVVLLQENKRYDIGLAVGYSTDTRMRGEISFQDRDFYQDAFNLKSVIRLEQLRQIGYIDIFLPPKESGYLDSFGVLLKRSDIRGLLTQSSSVGAKRVITENSVEKRLGLMFIYEQSALNDGEKNYSKALVPSIGQTWRSIDNTFDPHKGYVTQVDLSGASKITLSDQNFVRFYGKHQQWIPINWANARDVLVLRAEGGYVLSKDDTGIPEDLLFRAGGTGSVRGYAYQSLGVEQAGSIVGGRILATASAEYIHWLPSNLGIAGFIDVGDAADRIADFKIRQGVGFGVRYKTPAGPIAVDLAYGLQARKLRLDFFLGIAF